MRSLFPAKLWVGLLVVAALLLLALARPVSSLIAREVVIEDGDTVVTIKTRAKTVGDALAQAGVSVGEHDRMSIEQTAALGKHTIVVIQRAQPVTIRADGGVKVVHSCLTGVQELLELAGVVVGPDDLVEPPLDGKLDDDRSISVYRITFATEVIKETIPFAKETRANPSLEVGLSTVIQHGQNGEKQYTYHLTFRDGVEVARKLLAEVVTVAPKAYIVATGTKNTVTINGVVHRIVRAYISERATAYYPGPESTGVWADGITKLGIPAGEGVVAVDPKVVPLGSRLYVEGYGFAIAADVGGAIRGTAIDVCFDTKEKAQQWGVKRGVKFYILE